MHAVSAICLWATVPVCNTQKQMISYLLERNNMKGFRCSLTPQVPREQIMSLSEGPTQEEASVSDHKRFMKAVGSIQYIAAVTRPDIAYAANTLARHMAGNWQAMQRNIG